MAQPHHDDGVIVSGAFSIDPPLDDETCDLLDLVMHQSFRSALDERGSAVLDRLLPGHPEGANPWVACEDGCCLLMEQVGLVQIDAVQPWLAYLVGTTLKAHKVSGSVLWWDIAGDEHFALQVSGRQVRKKSLLKTRAKAAQNPGRRPALRSV